MPAFVTSNEHLSAILFAYSNSDRYSGVNDERLSELGTKLLNENVKSVNSRYRGARAVDGTPEFKLIEHYRHNPVTPVEALKLIRSLEYQSCNHIAWRSSEAKDILSVLTISLIHSLPGYEEAAWGI